MFYLKRTFVVCFLLLLAAGASFSQAKPGDGTDAQRLEVMSGKLERMRRSLESMASVLRDDAKEDPAKKDDKNNVGSPLGRTLVMIKDVSRTQGDVNGLKNKVNKNEKFERTELDSAEEAVAELQTRVDTLQIETAKIRAIPDSPVGKERTPKKKKKFLGIFGGGGKDEYEDLIGNVSPGRDRELFIVATREVRNNNYDVGRLLFQTIITTYPDSPYLPMSKLAVGDSFYVEGTTSALIQAVASYQDWLTFFPTHPLADRVVLKIAESEMRQIGLPDRDATRAKRAETRLKALLERYPNTILRPQATERLRQVQDNLGLHNLGIANYYYTLSVDQKKGGLKGSQSRYREILEKYPSFCFLDEALFKLAVTYQVEEETDQAARYFQRIVADYPDSKYAEKATEQLALIGATVPPPNPDRPKIDACEQPGFLANFKNQFFGVYPMTIDKDGVLLSKDFDKGKFELIDQIIENQGDILANQIPPSLTTVIRDNAPKQAMTVQQTAPPVKQP